MKTIGQTPPKKSGAKGEVVMIRKTWVAATLVALSTASAYAVGIVDIVNQVDKDQYRNYLDTMLYTHDGDNRRAGTGAQHDPARDNIASFFTGLGLNTSVDHFTYGGYTGDNVVAELTGVGHPENVYVFASHYDSVNCPGADDNASGTAGIMEAARVLSQYQFDATIRFIAFDREEQGMIGSYAYVAAHDKENFLGTISLDMIAYNAGGNNQAFLRSHDGSNAWKSALADAFSLYGNGITAFQQGALDGSDHVPFESAGFNGVLLIENYWNNPNYHTTEDSFDTPGYLDFDYAANMTRAAIGCIATAASPVTPVPEPATMIALATGVAALVARRRRR
jgi:Zn-dependent M28 family amino/carboxypeptidase